MRNSTNIAEKEFLIPGETEFVSIADVPLDWIGYSPVSKEWCLIFGNGKKLTLSSGEEAYYELTNEILH